MIPAIQDSRDLVVANETLRLRTEEPLQFIDITAWVDECSRRAGVGVGVAHIHVRHTTAAIVVNENEPLLLEDFEAMLERLAPSGGAYAHDDSVRRGIHRVADERPNGHAHTRALLLGTSKQVDVVEGRVDLGRWQSILLVELDGPRKRTVSLTVIGTRRNRA